MLKILKELGQMEGHFAVEIFKVEELGMIAVDHDTSNGETMEAWKCDSTARRWMKIHRVLELKKLTILYLTMRTENRISGSW